MRLLKKLLSLILVTSAIVTSLASCDRDYDEAEVIAAAEALIRKSDILEDIIFGVGFDYHLEGTSSYQPASEIDVERYSEALGVSVSTVDELKAVLSRIYTAGYRNDILSGVLSGDINSSLTRYYQDGEKIMVLTTYKPQKTDEIEYHYETLRVADVNDQKITVSLDVTVTRTEKTGSETTKKSQRITIEVDMLEEADGWKLDTPTYAVYNENYQNYKDLENELNKR